MAGCRTKITSEISAYWCYCEQQLVVHSSKCQKLLNFIVILWSGPCIRKK